MIASIAYTYDNLRRDRPEQKALSMAETLNTLNQGAGKDFHPPAAQSLPGSGESPSKDH
jgi:HD-GYP domain-containing protein (c-di-GMP phosphodiesterase class II)